MGTDYAARKQAKRKRKGIDLDSNGNKDSENRRTRSKRSQVRRLCQGMCYNPPALTAEDKAWDDRGDAYDSDVQPSRPPLPPPPPPPPASKAHSQLPGPPAAKKIRMSTSLQLPAGNKGSGVAPSSQDRQAGGTRTSKAAAAQGSFPPEIERYMQSQGFAEATPIQQECWPACLQGRDVLAVAEPGSGKTLGYLLPALSWLVRRQAEEQGGKHKGPAVLILVPTRELAQQVTAACRPARGLFGLDTACIHGGADKAAQVAELGKGPDILVATPGRLLDFVQASILSLRDVQYLVLDEADKMLSLGLQPQLDAIRAHVLPDTSAAPSKTQTGKRPKPVLPVPQVLLFTATMPAEVEATAEHWQRDPVRLHVATDGAQISRSVTQVVQVCAEHKKPRKLLKHLESVREACRGARNPPRVLIFANRVKTVRFVAATTSEAGFKTAILHGERSQPEREEAMHSFRSGKAQVLVATDVASRGLHIAGLPYIVSYDFPSRLDTYVHRVGRTGRLAAAGHAFSFFTRNLAPLAAPLVALLQEHDQMVDPNLVRLAEAYSTALAKMGAAAGPSTEARPGEDAPAAAAQQDAGAGVPATGEGWSDAEEEEAKPASKQRSTVRASELPGLYKSRSATGAEDAAESSSEPEDSDGADQEPGRFVRADANKQHSRAKAAPSSVQQGLDASLTETGKKEQTQRAKRAAARKRHSLPGRLRKKLAKDKGKKQ